MENSQLDHSYHQPRGKKFPVCFLAHDIENPINVGSLFRIADALAIEKIYLTGNSPVPPNSKITKAARSTEKYVSFAYEADPLPLVTRLRSEQYTLISLEITSSSKDIRALSISADEKVCLILGSENKGICQTLLDASNQTVHIPMLGQNSSMNLAVASAIAAFDIVKNYR